MPRDALFRFVVKNAKLVPTPSVSAVRIAKWSLAVRLSIARLLVFVAVASSCVFSLGSSAATLMSFDRDGKVVVVLDGQISLGDVDQLNQILKNANDAGKLVSAIRLNSPGGNLLEGAKLADAVRYAKMASVVAKGATCASACFLVFAAGTDKYVSYSASVGVHGASDENGQETEGSNAATVGMAKAARALGVPDGIIGRMVITPPDQIIWLSPNDLRSMGATMTGEPAQTPAEGVSQIPSEGAQPSLPSQEDQSGQAGIASSALAQLPSKQTALPTWGQLVDEISKASASQNNGTPRFVRTCQPELKSCFIAIGVTGKDGKEYFVKTTLDADGNMIGREFCALNQFGDVRDCVDWDKGTKHRDMKDSNGNWTEISGQ